MDKNKTNIIEFSPNKTFYSSKSDKSLHYFICRKKIGHKGNCNFDKDCIENLVCSNKTCACNSTNQFWSTYGDKCINYLDYGGVGCSMDSHCKANLSLICNRTFHNLDKRCVCPYYNGLEQYWDRETNNCTVLSNPIAKWNKACSKISDCSMDLGFYCLNGYCQRPNKLRLPVSYCPFDIICRNDSQRKQVCRDGVCVAFNYTNFTK